MRLSEGLKKTLLNECVGTINNQLEIFMFKRDTCTDKLKNIIKDQNIMAECKELIKMLLKAGTQELWRDKGLNMKLYISKS